MEAVEVIDFKTDKILIENIKERSLAYKRQCEAYKWAASEIYKVDINMISVKLVFLEVGEVVVEGKDF